MSCQDETRADLIREVDFLRRQIVELTGAQLDVDEANQALRRHEARSRRVVEEMPVLMDAFDAEGNIVLWNKECERVTGYSAEEVIDNPKAMELLYRDAVYRRRMMEEWVRRGDDYRDWEWEMNCKDGSTRIVAWSNISSRFPIRGWATWGIPKKP